MTQISYQPKWGAWHDAAVKRYEAKKMNGTARIMIIGIKDEQSP